jgi:geranylgeranyl diphosphate synthase type I
MTLVTRDIAGHAGELVTPILREMVERLDPGSQLLVSYHFGWCDEHGDPTDAKSGKAIRPALALLGAEACGVDPQIALPGAAAVEFVHNFSMVHDDLTDRVQERRHRAAVWAKWGDAAAVLAGDAMLSLAHEVLLKCTSDHRAAAQTTISSASRELIRGQFAEIEFENRDDVSLAESFSMAWGKTAALMAASAVVGVELAGGRASMRDALGAYGRQLGLAFQLVDDLLGIWGQPAVTGKPVYSDLRCRKKTLPITWTVENGGYAGRELAAWLADAAHAPTAADDELREVAELIELGGGRAWAYEQADRRAALAIDAVERANIPQGAAEQLQALAHSLVESTHHREKPSLRTSRSGSPRRHRPPPVNS